MIKMKTSLNEKTDKELLVMFKEYTNWARTKTLGHNISEYAKRLRETYYYSESKSIELAIEFTLCECAIRWAKGLEQ